MNREVARVNVTQSVEELAQARSRRSVADLNGVEPEVIETGAIPFPSDGRSAREVRWVGANRFSRTSPVDVSSRCTLIFADAHGRSEEKSA